MRVRFLTQVSTWLIGASLIAGSALAHEVSWPGKRLAKLMPEADSFKEQQAALTPAHIAAIERYPDIKVGQADRAPKLYLAYGKPASAGAKPPMLGVVAFIDTVGQYGPIELTVAVAPNGKVLKVDIWQHSDDPRIGAPVFLRQLAGRTIRHEFHIGHEIVAPEGGPRDSYLAIARGVQKALLLVQAVFGKGGIPPPPEEEQHEPPEPNILTEAGKNER